jgi:hypothetical protein
MMACSIRYSVEVTPCEITDGDDLVRRKLATSKA